MFKHKYLFISVLLIVVSGFVAFFSRQDTQELWESNIESNYQTYAMNLPTKVSFCGEEVPLNRVDVREALDLELLKNVYWHSNTYLMIKRANRWFPIIDSVLLANKIPSDFKYLALIESSLSNAISPAGAAGYWQILKVTGTQFNLEINEEVDERYHVVKSTEVACKYFKQAYDRFNNWTLVAASYNIGMNGLDKRISEQGELSYYDLYLNSETGRYVYRILAAKIIFLNLEGFGFNLRKRDVYPIIPTIKIKVDSAVNSWVEFAKNQNVSYKTLRYFNPWIRADKLTNAENKIYYIELPQKEFYDYTQLLTEDKDLKIDFH